MQEKINKINEILCEANLREIILIYAFASTLTGKETKQNE